MRTKSALVNVQNIPREDKVIKRAFVPKLDCLVFADYKQIEPRLFGYYLARLGSTRFVDYVKSGVDPYTAIGMGYFGRPDLTDKERQLAKHTFLSLIYGGGLPAIRRYFEDLDWNGAQKIKDQFYRAWPELTLLQESLKGVMEKRGYITTLWGRHLRPQSDHKAVNALLQGCAADLMRQSIVDVHRALTGGGFDSHLVSSVHDELIVDATFSELPDVVARLSELMVPDLLNEVIPIEVDIEWSTTNWADKVPLEKEALLAA